MTKKALIRVRMSCHDAHYGGNLVDGARMLNLFGDVATELLIINDGDEGLFKAYDSVEFILFMQVTILRLLVRSFLAVTLQERWYLRLRKLSCLVLIFQTQLLTYLRSQSLYVKQAVLALFQLNAREIKNNQIWLNL